MDRNPWSSSPFQVISFCKVSANARNCKIKWQDFACVWTTFPLIPASRSFLICFSTPRKLMPISMAIPAADILGFCLISSSIFSELFEVFSELPVLFSEPKPTVSILSSELLRDVSELSGLVPELSGLVSELSGLVSELSGLVPELFGLVSELSQHPSCTRILTNLLAELI